MKGFIAVVTVWSLILAAAPVFAEGFLDIYAGPSFTDTANVTVGTSSTSASRKVGFTNELTYGIRGGYWFSKLPWMGVGGDISSQHARGANVKFDLTPISPKVLFRLPLLKDEEAPYGRIQPYAGIGPSISLYTYGSVDFGPPLNGTNDWDVCYGVEVPAGIAVQVARHLALFTEYRYALYDIKIKYDSWFSSDREIRTTLSQHNLLFGVSFRF